MKHRNLPLTAMDIARQSVNVIIDPEFKSLIPPLDEDEREKLKASLKAEGCRDPLLLWADLLVDGHNRKEICEANGIPFETRQMGFATRVEARIWIRNNQLGRRNLTDAWKIDLQLANKAELAEVGKAKYKSTVGRPRKSLSNNDSDLPTPKHDTRQTIAKAAGVSTGKVGQAEVVKAKAPELWEKAKAGDITIGKAYADTQREERRREVTAKLNATATLEVKAIQGVYDVIVIDPPWPMEKIERDVTPNQVAFAYPTMTEAELEVLPIPAADDCHVWLWTTHKFLPMAFRLLSKWGMKYVCTFVWHKPGGFQPFGLPQYNCEFALYARKGAPAFTTTKAFPVCFDAKRTEHSEKPEDFYGVVRRVTAGRRLDMFNRRTIEGFNGWGKESPSDG